MTKSRGSTRVALLFALGAVLGGTGQGQTDSQPRRTIVLALDAVPYATVVSALASRGVGDPLLSGMQGPSALISTFPSSTSLAMGGILEPVGLTPSLGYEARFFDRERNALRGGGLISYNRNHLKFGWRKVWDWKAGNVRKITSGLRPIRASISAIEDALDAFLHSDESLFLAYCDATDLVGHLRSPAKLEVVLDRLDRILKAAHARHPDQPFTTVLFSDHGQDGGAPLDNVRGPVRQAIEGAGLRLTKRIERDSDVVLVPYGLLSSIVAYTRPETASQAAEVIAAVAGVDFCVTAHHQPDRWLVTGSSGTAQVERRTLGAAVRWRYRRITGDPLELHDVRDWHGDRWWFEKTRGHGYPDPFHRIARGFDLVTHSASVLCSLDAEHMYGAAVTSISSRLTVGRLHWTHGAMLRDSSLGFLMSDFPGWRPPPAVRFDEALVPFVSGARAE